MSAAAHFLLLNWLVNKRIADAGLRCTRASDWIYIHLTDWQRSPTAYVRKNGPAPHSDFEHVTLRIVAATGMCQGSDFHSSRATALWKLSACSATAVRVRVNKQAFRCYEYDPLTFRCPLTKFRAAGCALLPERILRCRLTSAVRPYYTNFAEAEPACILGPQEEHSRW
jgi:hypothetical protein